MLYSLLPTVEHVLSGFNTALKGLCDLSNYDRHYIRYYNKVLHSQWMLSDRLVEIGVPTFDMDVGESLCYFILKPNRYRVRCRGMVPTILDTGSYKTRNQCLEWQLNAAFTKLTVS